MGYWENMDKFMQQRPMVVAASKKPRKPRKLKELLAAISRVVR